MARLTTGLLVLLVTLGAAAAPATGALTDQQLARYHGLNAELRCLICQNRSIAESDAPLAADLRAIVARQIAAGRSNDQIKQFLVDRYGQWVLYDPPFQFSTLILWLGPFVLLLTGLVIVVRALRRRRSQSTPPAALDRARLAEVLAEHERGAQPVDPTSAEPGRRST